MARATQEKVTAIIAEVAGRDAVEITPSYSIVDNFDSMDMCDLGLSLEDEFGIEVPAYPEFTTARSVVEWIKAHASDHS